MKIIGQFVLFIYGLFANRERFSVYLRLIVDECMLIGVNSVFIVTIVSTFIGAVSAVQTAYNLISPLIPLYIIGQIVRDMTILELAPTITCIVLAGKVGSNIAGGLGTMRITEQIDALEVMGINSISYLVLPKIIAAMITFPMLVVLAGFLSIVGGFLAGTLTGELTEVEYIKGIRADFNEFSVTFALIKAVVFAFLIASISAFQGYYTKGGALEVGQSSTQAVTNSCIAVLFADYLLAELLL
ncbi:MAG TPA: ABC transporter permease [Microscillaceae bacterium]|jgi:phospholipid/cholesterol/gamma-HCH transport system permease protein|nr:ABC transporter permease [Microscillaceae bacterium]